MASAAARGTMGRTPALEDLMPEIALSRTPRTSIWAAIQALGVVLTGALVWALIQWPTLALHVLWDMVIPLLPAVFLLNPMLWRNVCPLATLNDWTSRPEGRPVSRPFLHAAWIVGILLLALLVPARRFLFNVDGTSLALTITGVGMLALVSGLRFPRRAGFCNSLCPVLPVEKLYGQSPLLPVSHSRCTRCDVCTPAGCIDLAGGKSARQSLGARGATKWLGSPFGVFAAGFPGFIVGYFTTPDSSLAAAGGVYLGIAAWTVGSYLIVVLLATLLRPRVSDALPVLGATSAALYYWFAAPGLGASYRFAANGPLVVRVVAFALVSCWLWKALGLHVRRI